MNSSRIAVIAAAAAVAAWAAKAVAIGLAGGLDQSPAEGPLFMLGLVCGLVAVGALAVSASGSTQWWARTAAAVAGLVLLVVVVGLTSAGLEAIATSDHWAWSEVNLWVTSLAVLALGVRHHSRRTQARTLSHA
jgi:hypothetical protein